MKNLMKLCALAALSLLVACQGPDPIRLRSERANLALAKRCANGWFSALPFTADDMRLVQQAFDDWDLALQADEKLVAPMLGGSAK